MKKNNKGFSLVELMVVVAIIGILAAVAIPNFQRFQRKARQSEAKTMLGGYYTSMKAFHTEWEQFTGAFDHIGFSPEGNLGYRLVGADADPYLWIDGENVQDNIGPYDQANNLPYNAAYITTETWCGVAPANKCIEKPTAQFNPTTAPAINNQPGSDDTFIAAVAGNIGTANVDEWSINEVKTLVLEVDGVAD